MVAEIDTARIRYDEDLRSITRAANRQATTVPSVRVLDILPVRSETA